MLYCTVPLWGHKKHVILDVWYSQTRMTFSLKHTAKNECFYLDIYISQCMIKHWTLLCHCHHMCAYTHVCPHTTSCFCPLNPTSSRAEQACVKWGEAKRGGMMYVLCSEPWQRFLLRKTHSTVLFDGTLMPVLRVHSTHNAPIHPSPLPVLQTKTKPATVALLPHIDLRACLTYAILYIVWL